MQTRISTLLLIGASLLLCIGALYAATLTIPTKPADHNAYLNTLHLGTEQNAETITLDPSQQVVVIPHKLIAGDTSSNTIASDAEYAVIAGGRMNKILDGASNSVIGAGLMNTIQSQNSVIGAGE
jgi:hypothetical protein